MQVTLRAWQLDDAAALANLLNNRAVQDCLRDGLPYPYTQRDGLAFIRAMQAADRNQVMAFAVTADHRLVGSLSLTRQQNIHHRTAELGYFIAQDDWGKGFATSAVQLACQFAWSQTDLLRIFAQPFSSNHASCRVLEKAGFTLEGVLRQNAVKQGVVRDMRLYALLRDPGLSERPAPEKELQR